MLDLSSSEIKQFGSANDLLLRVAESPDGAEVAEGIKANLRAALPGSIDERRWVQRQEKVGPKVGQELRQDALRAVLVALALILAYMAWRFHRFVWGAAAVLATFHDVLITVGLIALLRIELSLGVVAAVLTIVGYSINDTIVVFDRIREALKVRQGESFTQLLNLSINQTLTRTVITGACTLFAVVVLILWGGEVNRDFAVILCIGLVVGTYSSVFVASPILLLLERWAIAPETRTKERNVELG